MRRFLVMVLALAPSLVLPLPASAEQPSVALEDDGNKLFEQDPNPGGDEGGACQVCEYNFNTRTLRCVQVSGGNGFSNCKITVKPGEVSCETSGSSCSALRVIS